MQGREQAKHMNYINFSITELPACSYTVKTSLKTVKTHPTSSQSSAQTSTAIPALTACQSGCTKTPCSDKIITSHTEHSDKTFTIYKPGASPKIVPESYPHDIKLYKVI